MGGLLTCTRGDGGPDDGAELGPKGGWINGPLSGGGTTPRPFGAGADCAGPAALAMSGRRVSSSLSLPRP